MILTSRHSYCSRFHSPNGETTAMTFETQDQVIGFIPLAGKQPL